MFRRTPRFLTALAAAACAASVLAAPPAAAQASRTPVPASPTAPSLPPLPPLPQLGSTTTAAPSTTSGGLTNILGGSSSTVTGDSTPSTTVASSVSLPDGTPIESGLEPPKGIVDLYANLPAMRPLNATGTMDGLAARYGSLSSTLMAFYADQARQPLSSFVAQAAPQLATTLGKPSLVGLDAQNLAALNTQLTSSGAALDLASAGSLDGYARQLADRSSSIDATVALAGAKWATELGGLHTPLLARPKAGDISAAAYGVPTEGLMFGMFAERSITAMVNDFPDVFAKVRGSGLGTAESQAAWSKSMMSALSASRPDFTSMLPSPCHAVMLNAMASGNAATADDKVAGKNCGTCATSGVYLNSQLNRLFDPKVGSTLSNPSDQLLPPSEFNSLQAWQRDAILQQNPGFAQSLSQSLGADTGAVDCKASSTATSGTLATTLPGVFRNLSR